MKKYVYKSTLPKYIITGDLDKHVLAEEIHVSIIVCNETELRLYKRYGPLGLENKYYMSTYCSMEVDHKKLPVSGWASLL